MCDRDQLDLVLTRGRGQVPPIVSSIVAGGIGSRSLLRPQDSPWVGIDPARGPEDTICSIQIGGALK
jgi:hypothetical protein